MRAKSVSTHHNNYRTENTMKSIFSKLLLALLVFALIFTCACKGGEKKDKIETEEKNKEPTPSEAVDEIFLPNSVVYKDGPNSVLFFMPGGWMATDYYNDCFSDFSYESPKEVLTVSLIRNNNAKLDREFCLTTENNAELGDLSKRDFSENKTFNGFDSIIYSEIDENELHMTVFTDIGNGTILCMDFTDIAKNFDICKSVADSISVPDTDEIEYNVEFSFTTNYSFIYENGEHTPVTLTPKRFNLTLPSYCTVNKEGTLFRWEEKDAGYDAVYENVDMPPYTSSVHIPDSMTLEEYLKSGADMPFENKNGNLKPPSVTIDDLTFITDKESGIEYAYGNSDSTRSDWIIYLKTKDNHVLYLTTEVFSDNGEENIRKILNSIN